MKGNVRRGSTLMRYIEFVEDEDMKSRMMTRTDENDKRERERIKLKLSTEDVKG